MHFLKSLLFALMVSTSVWAGILGSSNSNPQHQNRVIAYPVASNSAKDLHDLFAHCGTVSLVEICTQSELNKEPVARISFQEPTSAKLALFLNGITLLKDGMWVVSDDEKYEKQITQSSCTKHHESGGRQQHQRTASEVVADMIKAGYCKTEEACNDIKKRAQDFDDKHEITDTAKGWASKVYEKAKEIVTGGSDTAEAAKDEAAAKYDKAQDAAHNAKNQAKDAAHDAKNAATDAVQNAKDTAKEYAHDAKNQASDAAQNAKNAASDAAQNAKDTIKDYAQNAKDAASDKAQQAKDTVKDYAQTAKDTAAEYAHAAADKASDAAQAAKETVVDAAQSAKDTAKEYAQSAKDTAAEYAHAAADKASEGAEQAGNAMHRGYAKMKEAAYEGYEKAKDTLKEAGEAAENAAETAKERVENAYDSLKGK